MPAAMAVAGDRAEARRLARVVEAILFAAERPLTLPEIEAHAGAGAGEVLATLAQDYAGGGEVGGGRGVRLVERGGAWQIETVADLAPYLRALRPAPRKLGRAATETLAIIAYREPVTRAEIEAIRGVQLSKGTLDLLMEAGWVRPAGRREVPGRPTIYATTPAFLTHFGLRSRRDLPGSTS